MAGGEATRLARAERRDAILDVAAALIDAGRLTDLSMESVADAAGVSRALVYKHFANRQELLAALYERESARLHRQLSADVAAADGLADMLRALIAGALAAQASRGATFAALGHVGARPRSQKDRQRRRDAQTLRYFTAQATKEFSIDPHRARAVLAIGLSAIAGVLAVWRERPTKENAALLADSYVAIIIGGLAQLQDGEPS